MSNSLKNEMRTKKTEPRGHKKLPRWPIYLAGASLLAGAAAFSTYKLANHPAKNETESISVAKNPKESSEKVFFNSKLKTTIRKDELTVENIKTGEVGTAKIKKQLDMDSVLVFLLEPDEAAIVPAFKAVAMELPAGFFGAVNFGAYDDSDAHVSIILCADHKIIAKSDADTDRYANFVRFLDSSKIGKEGMKRIVDIAMNGTQEEKENLIDELSYSEFLTRNVWDFVLKNRYATKENLIATDLAALVLREKLNMKYTAEEANQEQLLSSINHELTHTLHRTFLINNRKDYPKSTSLFYEEYMAYLSEFLYADPQLVLLQSLITFSRAIGVQNQAYSAALIMVPRDLQDELDAEDFLELSEASDDELRTAANKLLDKKARMVFGKSFDEIADSSFYMRLRVFYEK